MKHFLIVSGGHIVDDFACHVLESEKPDIVIAADAGMEFFYRNGKCPDVIVGDFDSAETETLSHFKKQGVEICALNPIKNDTDTEFAIRLAIGRGAGQITLLGATGSRLDHVLGNIELLGIGLDAGVPITILDSYNRIRMIDCGIKIGRAKQFGTYVSLLPYTQSVEHLTLTGFKYPLTDYCLKGFCSLGVSNEIAEEEASIQFSGGILLVIESRDTTEI